MSKRKTIEDIKQYIEKEGNGECVYLEGEYINNTSLLTFRCNLCGENFIRDFAHLSRGRTCCSKCARKKANKKISCSIQDVYNFLVEKGQPCELISNEYINSKSKLIFKCKCGENFLRDFEHLKRGAFTCEKCYRASFRKYNFDKDTEDQESISTDLFKVKMRLNISSWREDCLKAAQYQCDISKEKINLEVHHLNSNFIDLLYQAVKNVNLPYYKYSYEYTEEEFYKIRDELLKLHRVEDGVVLTKKIHNDFHKMYGFKNNTAEQYFQFKQKYLNQKN